MISKETIKKRIASGMTPEQAETLPLQWVKNLTIKKVLEIESHGISITSSAILLDVNPQTLHAFIKRHNIQWRGKGYNFKKGEVNPNSNFQRAKALGLCNMTIQKRMERNWISFEEAAAMKKRSYKRMTNDVVLQTVAIRATGKTIKDAAKILGVDYGYLLKRVKQHDEANKP